MAFKVNVSQKGKTYKEETESEDLVGKNIGETIKGEDVSDNLKGYKLKITGTSDIAGIPGFQGLEGNQYHRVLRSLGPGMKNRKKGLRLRKTNRGEEISLKTIQVNTIVEKEGTKKFDQLFTKEESAKTEQLETPKESDEKKPEAVTDNKSKKKKEEEKKE